MNRILPLAFVMAFATASIANASTWIWNQSRTTPYTSGVVASDGWEQPLGGFEITWNITYDTNVPDVYHYSYTITDDNGATTLNPDLSHLILQVSSTFTAADIWKVKLDGQDLSLSSGDPQLYTSSGNEGSTPYMPAGGIFGIKLDAAGGQSTHTFTYSFDSDRAPMWGSFYAKDGKHPDAGNNTEFATAWNTGFGTNPAAGATDLTNWVLVPDSSAQDLIPPDSIVPEPVTAIFFGTGLATLFGFAARRRMLRKA